MSTDVAQIGTPAEFVAALRALRERAQLSYRELEEKATALGERLPRATIANALSRGHLPGEEIIASFVRACGEDALAVERWLATHRRLAQADLSHAVERWVHSRWQVRAEKPRPDLASAVENWLVTRWRKTTPKAATTIGYAEGRLAEAAARAQGGRWRGLHRRSKRGRPDRA
ncbi:MAG: hypothetical protein HOV76_02785 [Hamadaea sp.]|nr:hypothetical protein [Hamadaea sp.]